MAILNLSVYLKGEARIVPSEKKSIAKFKETKTIWDNNTVGSPSLVRMTRIPVKAKPAKSPHIVWRPITKETLLLWSYSIFLSVILLLLYRYLKSRAWIKYYENYKKYFFRNSNLYQHSELCSLIDAIFYQRLAIIYYSARLKLSNI